MNTKQNNVDMKRKLINLLCIISVFIINYSAIGITKAIDEE